MNILQLSPYFHPYVGGQERYVRSLANALKNHGHNVEIYTSNSVKGNSVEYIDDIKIKDLT